MLRSVQHCKQLLHVRPTVRIKSDVDQLWLVAQHLGQHTTDRNQAIGVAVARAHWIQVVGSKDVTEVRCYFVGDVAFVSNSVRVLPSAPHRKGITIDAW